MLLSARPVADLVKLSALKNYIDSNCVLPTLHPCLQIAATTGSCCSLVAIREEQDHMSYTASSCSQGRVWSRQTGKSFFLIDLSPTLLVVSLLYIKHKGGAQKPILASSILPCRTRKVTESTGRSYFKTRNWMPGIFSHGVMACSTVAVATGDPTVFLLSFWPLHLINHQLTSIKGDSTKHSAGFARRQRIGNKSHTCQKSWQTQYSSPPPVVSNLGEKIECLHARCHPVRDKGVCQNL